MSTPNTLHDDWVYRAFAFMGHVTLTYNPTAQISNYIETIAPLDGPCIIRNLKFEFPENHAHTRPCLMEVTLSPGNTFPSSKIFDSVAASSTLYHPLNHTESLCLFRSIIQGRSSTVNTKHVTVNGSYNIYTQSIIMFKLQLLDDPFPPPNADIGPFPVLLTFEQKS